MDLRERLWHDFRLDLRLEPVDGGTTGGTHRGVAPDGRRYAVKWSAAGPTAGVVLCEGARWTDRGGRRLTVMPWFDGPTALEGSTTRAHWVAWGRRLAALHARPVTEEIARWVPREGYDARPWVAVLDRVDRALAGYADGDEVTRRLVECWTAGRDRLLAVRERALSPVRPAAGVPCHADVHQGNVILTGPDDVAFVDFDDAVLAPPERDLMFLLDGGIFADRPVTAEQRDWFFEGYGPHAVDRELLAHFRCVRALEDVAVPAEVVLASTVDQGGRVANLGYVEASLHPGGIVDQALL